MYFNDADEENKLGSTQISHSEKSTSTSITKGTTISSRNLLGHIPATRIADINNEMSSGFQNVTTTTSITKSEETITVRKLSRVVAIDEPDTEYNSEWKERNKLIGKDNASRDEDSLFADLQTVNELDGEYYNDRTDCEVPSTNFDVRISVQQLQDRIDKDTSSKLDPRSVKRLRKRISSRELMKSFSTDTDSSFQKISEETETSGDERRENIIRQASKKRKSARVHDSLSTKDLQSWLKKRTEQKRKGLIKKFVGAITVHGYAQFHEASGLRKVMWGIILAAMAVFIVRIFYLTFSSDNYYKQVIEFKTEKVQHISFPTVTICNFSPKYNKNIFKRFPVNISEDEFQIFYHLVLSNRAKERSIWERSSGAKELKKRVINELRSLGYVSFKDVLQLFEKYQERDIHSEVINTVMKEHKCLYENKPCVFDQQFTTVYRHASQSLCKQFNFYQHHKDGLASIGNDRENGLFMFWDISGNNFYYDHGLDGLLVEIHPYGTPHHLIDHRHTIYLQPGAMTHIDIEQHSTQRLPFPFSPYCGRGDMEIIKNYPYTQAVCEVDCFLQNMYSKCGCVVDQFAKHVGDIQICNISQMECTFKASAETHCHDCPFHCDDVQYKVSTSRLAIGNNLVFETLKYSPTWKNKSDVEIEAYIQRNIVGFRIGFKSLEKQIRMYKEAVPWHQRISMLGGMMGLLLGFSVITGFELLFFLFDYLYLTMKYRFTQEYLSYILKQEAVSSSTQPERGKPASK